MFRERDRDRLRRRLRAIAGGDLSGTELDRLLAGDLSLVSQLPLPSQQGVYALLKQEPDAGGALEKMIGAALDYVPVAYLDLARMAANSVARVVEEDREPLGTGVLVSTRLLLTNNHVTKSPAEAAKQVLQFDYELQVDGVPKVPTEYRLDPATFFVTSDEAELDFTLVAVGPPVSNGRPLSAFGMASLSAAGDKHAEGDFVTVIQHPQGNFKQVALRENRVVGRGQAGKTLHYQSDTLPGSSGSPVYNDQFELVALHHAGGTLLEETLEDGSAVPADTNEGVRISAIVGWLRDVLDTLPDPQRALLAEALDPPSVGPRLTANGHVPAEAASGAAGITVGTAAADVSVPLRIRIGAGEVPSAVVAVAAPAAPVPAPVIATAGTPAAAPVVGFVERNQPPSEDYHRRRGYDASFLDVEVPIPALSEDLLRHAAVPEDRDRTQEGIVLRYLHFSILQNAERRMPFLTAVNIDGKRARNINRQTGQVEAAEKWYLDPRIPEDAQIDQSVFTKQTPRIFDRGHLVRRLDPAWGSVETVVRAANDTFHFTNCCPQVAAFNQGDNLWAGIEDYVLLNAKAERLRVSVFSGPVFADGDPPYRSIHVPKAYWKVLARIEDGTLRCTGFLASQADLLTAAGVEEFADLGRVATFQTPLSTLADLTGIDFGPLAEFDTSAAEAVAGAPIESLDDVRW